MSAPSIRFAFETGAFASTVVEDGLFGANALLGRDDLSGTYGTKIQDMGVSLLRYPGGGLTEDYFDPANPDAIIVTPTAGHVGITDFLAYCAANSIRPAIVLPTKRYLENPAAGEQILSDFVAAVTRGDYGPVTDPIFQIGNEYYATTVLHEPITTEEYASIAPRFAVAVANAAQGSATVVVQMGRKPAENVKIINEFDTAIEKAAVDGLSFHQYPWRYDAVEERFEKVQKFLAKWEAAGIGGFTFMSEWNVGSSGDATKDPFHDYGQAQNVALLELIHHSVIAGIDLAAIWGVQQNNKTALGANEGNTEVYSSGELYRLMSESIPGARSLGKTVSNDGSVISYAYENDAEVTVFVAARDIDLTGGPVQVDLDLDGIAAGYTTVSAVSLTTTDVLTDPRIRPTITNSTPQLGISEGDLVASVTLTQDYEVVRVTFVKQSSVLSSANQIGGGAGDIFAGGAGDDTFRGNDGADYIYAHDGNDDVRGGRLADELRGGGGADTVAGGSGDDFVAGGDGDDLLSGGSGRDRLHGSRGDDTIEGGSGRDFIYGGAGDDQITGGNGNDRIWGKTGADTFIFGGTFGLDRINDFEVGTDVMDLSAIGSVTGFGDLTITQSDNKLFIAMTEGTIALRGILQAQIDADDFVF